VTSIPSASSRLQLANFAIIRNRT